VTAKDGNLPTAADERFCRLDYPTVVDARVIQKHYDMPVGVGPKFDALGHCGYSVLSFNDSLNNHFFVLAIM
jgi:hypothetical protein